MVFHSLEEALSYFKNDDRKIFVIGGGEIYKMAIDKTDLIEMFITHVNGEFNADTFFPEFDKSKWVKELLLSQSIDERHACEFETFVYRRSDR